MSELRARASRLTLRYLDRRWRRLSVEFVCRDLRQLNRMLALVQAAEAGGDPVTLCFTPEEEERVRAA